MRFLLEDPRPDLNLDSARWCRLFRLILSLGTKSEPLLKTLWSMRSYGTTLLPHRLGLKLEPVIGGHWESQEEFDEMKRKHLGPHAKEIMDLFKRLEGEHE